MVPRWGLSSSTDEFSSRRDDARPTSVEAKRSIDIVRTDSFHVSKMSLRRVGWEFPKTNEKTT